MSISTLDNAGSAKALDALWSDSDQALRVEAHRQHEAAAARQVVEAIKAIPSYRFAPATVAAIAAALSDRVASSFWSATADAELATQVLDNLHDDMEAA